MNKPVPRGVAIPRPNAIIQKLHDPIWTGEKQESIIHPEFSGLTFITGFRGKGKSSLLEKFDDPANLVMVDLESKEEEDATKQLEVGGYFPVMKELATAYGSDYDIQSVYDRILQIANSMPKYRFTVFAIDNAQELVEGAKRFIQNNPDVARKYGLVAQNVAENKFGATQSGAKHLINNLYQTVMSKVKCFIVTFQLRAAWANNQPAFNKFRTTELTTWHELSKLTLVMVDPIVQHFPNPRAIVMKEAYSQKKWDREKKEFTQIRRIPPAIPKATPQEIYKYLDEPWKLSEPKPGELVTPLELSPFTPTFGNEQLYLMREMVALQEKLGMTGGESE
jgi:hypothetical protein